MPDTIIGQQGLDTTRHYSVSVWEGAKLEEMSNAGTGCVVPLLGGFDFDTLPATGTHYSLVGASAAMVPVLTSPGGVANLTCNAAANGEAYYVGGIALGAFGMIEQNKNRNELWWETRIKVSDIINGVYITGLTKASDVAAGMLVNGTLVPATTVSALGFRTLLATPSRLDIFYMDDATATVYVVGAATLTTTAWVKLGIHFDGKKTRFYVNGVEKANTAGTMGVGPDATNFPDAIGLHTFWGCKSNASAALTMSIDWWRGAQQILDGTYDAA